MSMFGSLQQESCKGYCKIWKAVGLRLIRKPPKTPEMCNVI